MGHFQYIICSSMPMCQDSGRRAYIFKIYSRYVLVSNQDFKSLAKTILNNLARNCVHHIKENLRTRFGPKQLKWSSHCKSFFYCSRGDVLDETLRAIRKGICLFGKNSNYSVAEYTMDYNKKVTYTRKITSLV